MSVLPIPEIPPDDPSLRDLGHIFGRAYAEKPDAKVVVAQTGLDVADVNWDQAVSKVWGEIVRLAGRRGRLRAMLEFALTDPGVAGFRAEFEGYVVGLQQPRPAPDLAARLAAAAVDIDAPNAQVLGTLAFVDRTSLRGKVRRLMDAQRQEQVLLVVGDPESGRSYSWFLIAHVGRKTGAFSFHQIDLSRWVQGVGAAEVAAIIATELGWAVPAADPTAQPEAVAWAMLAWLKRAANESKRQAWLVFDGLDKVPDSTLQFVIDVAMAAASRQLGDFRVILLALKPGPSSADLEQFALTDVLADVPLDELTAFLQAVSERSGHYLGDDQIAELLRALLGDPVPDPVPPKRLGKSFREAVLKLAGVDDG